MSGPTVTDWISAGSSVVQTVGALSAIGVTAWIAFRSEKDIARREREAIERETLARHTAEKRAEEAIARAAAAEEERRVRAQVRLVVIALDAIENTMAAFETQLSNFPPEPGNNLDISYVSVDWTAAEACTVTLQALIQRTDDPWLGSLFEQAVLTLKQPDRIANLYLPAAVAKVRSIIEQLGIICKSVEHSAASDDANVVATPSQSGTNELAM